MNMTEEFNTIKGKISDELKKPKSKNVGKNNSKFYKGVSVDQVVARDPSLLKDLYKQKNDSKPVSEKRKFAGGRNHERAARMKAKSYVRRGKAMSYMPIWK